MNFTLYPREFYTWLLSERPRIFLKSGKISGNPMGYTRTTQHAKFMPEAQRYECWKKYVWEKFCDSCSSKFSEIPPGKKFFLATMCYFEKGGHCDPSNVHKGIEDALADTKWERRVYQTDRYACGAFDFEYDPENPRVECEIFPVENQEDVNMKIEPLPEKKPKKTRKK